MSASKAPEPPNVYFAPGSISGNTFVSDAAASTVGTEPPALEVALADAEAVVDDDVAADCEAVVLELLLLPHAAASAETPIAIKTTTNRAEVALNTRTAFLTHARILAP